MSVPFVVSDIGRQTDKLAHFPYFLSTACFGKVLPTVVFVKQRVVALTAVAQPASPVPGKSPGGPVW